MGQLTAQGHELTPHPSDADVIVVNTCSFIDPAKQESVDTILEMAGHKTGGKAKKLVVAGCLVERFRDQIRKDIPEVDAVVGTGELQDILAATGIASPQAQSNSPFVILGTRPEGDAHPVEAHRRGGRNRPGGRPGRARRGPGRAELGRSEQGFSVSSKLKALETWLF